MDTKEISIDELINLLKKDSIKIIDVSILSKLIKTNIYGNKEEIMYTISINANNDYSIMFYIDNCEYSISNKSISNSKNFIINLHNIYSDICNFLDEIIIQINTSVIQNILYGDKHLFIPYFCFNTTNNNSIYLIIYDNINNNSFEFEYDETEIDTNKIFNNKILKEVIDKKYIYNKNILIYNKEITIKSQMENKISIKLKGYNLSKYLRSELIGDDGNNTSIYGCKIYITIYDDEIFVFNIYVSDKSVLIYIKNELLELNKNLTENDIEIIYEKDENNNNGE